MLAPLRPRDSRPSPLLSVAKDCYFSRLSACIHPGKPGFEESRWITSEDVNVEYLLDVFISIDVDSKNAWSVCVGFMNRLFWNKPRLIMLGPKIEALPDNHPSKAQCLQYLLFHSIGNWAEYKRILTYALKLWGEQGDDAQAAVILSCLSNANRLIGFEKEAILQAREASEIFERLGNTVKQAKCLIDLGRSLYDDEQLDAAEETASRAIDLLPEEGEQFMVCNGHHVLGDTEKAIHHFEEALGIASPLDWHGPPFWIHFSLADLFSEEGKFNDAHAHVEQARSHAVNDAYNLARASRLQARFWNKQHIFGEAKSETCVLLMCSRSSGPRAVWRRLESFSRRLSVTLEEMDSDLATPDEPDDDDELLETMPLAVCINSPCSD